MNLPLLAAAALVAFALRPARRSPLVLVPGARRGSPFGEDRGDHTHQGVDLGAPEGTPVHAAHDGVVAGVWRNGALSGAGNTVSLRTRDGRTATVYMHLARFAPELREGGRVRRGDVLGFVGRTDSSADNGLMTSSGPHLHFEVLRLTDPAEAAHFTGTHPARVDPVAWMRQHGVRVPT